MGKNTSIVLIGKRMGSQEFQFKSKPSFADAVQLSLKSRNQYKNASYQSFPLTEDTKIIFYYRDITIQLTLDQLSWVRIDSETPLTEEEVIDVSANFVLKEGSKITYLTMPPSRKKSYKKENKPDSSFVAKANKHNDKGQTSAHHQAGKNK
ncbi:hypothetical protein [Neobacillus jeddahensis]|uniref:hypothetical protein n=1 Tax=Neobacillus jeddahensis TaxID=1461580 RepID=UPI00058EADCB|nr:hypothetical protein [Neobacillus jeddahensis]